MTDLENRLRWISALLDGVKHDAPSPEIRRHLGRARSSVELAIERLSDTEGQAA